MQYLHLGELGSSSSGNLGHTELGQLVLQVVQLLEQLFLLLASQVSCLDLGLDQDTAVLMAAPCSVRQAISSWKRHHGYFLHESAS